VSVLHEQLLYLFHVQHVPTAAGLWASKRVLRVTTALGCSVPNLCQRVLLMDEATQRASRNQRTWYHENPYSFQETRFQQLFTINVWAGVICYLLLSRYELPPPLWKACHSFYKNNYRKYWAMYHWQRSRRCAYCMKGALPILLAMSCGA
jgi:hypothetical protein